jgi:hypothetical protein
METDEGPHNPDVDYDLPKITKILDLGGNAQSSENPDYGGLIDTTLIRGNQFFLLGI